MFQSLVPLKWPVFKSLVPLKWPMFKSLVPLKWPMFKSLCLPFWWWTPSRLATRAVSDVLADASFDKSIHVTPCDFHQTPADATKDKEKAETSPAIQVAKAGIDCLLSDQCLTYWCDLAGESGNQFPCLPFSRWTPYHLGHQGCRWCAGRCIIWQIDTCHTLWFSPGTSRHSPPKKQTNKQTKKQTKQTK